MYTGDSKNLCPRELPSLPQRGQRTRPTMPSQETGEDVPAARGKKKRAKKESNGVDDMDGNPGTEMGDLSSRRASEVVGPLTSESTTDGPPQRRRRKKKKKTTPTVELQEDRADLVDEDMPEQTTDGEDVVKKLKKKKKPNVVGSQHCVELDVDEDDIITETVPTIPQNPLLSLPQVQSQPVGKVFIERNKRFQAAERSDWRKTSDQMDNLTDFQHVQPLWTTREVSIRVHNGFRLVGLFCHGFLAGYAVWHVVVVYMLAGQRLATLSNLLEQYHLLAYPSQSLLYLLLAVSTVAAFDRLNLARGSTALRDFITLDPVALASFLYFSALVLSLSQQMTSDRINFYHTANGTLWPPGSEHQILHPWMTVNLVVAVLVGLAWIFISSRPESDYTEGYLRAMELEPPKSEDRSEVTA